MTRRQAIQRAERAVTEWGVFMAYTMNKKWRPVEAVYLDGGLCVHPHIPAYPAEGDWDFMDIGWVVSHVGTGLRIGNVLESPEDALVVAGRLLSLSLNWTLGDKRIQRAVKRAKLLSTITEIAY